MSVTAMLPETIKRRDEFFNRAKAAGYMMIQTSGFRSYDEQLSLYQRWITGQGAYAVNPDVKQSKHMTGEAFDAAPVSVRSWYGGIEHWEGVERGWDSLTDESIEELGAIAESVGLKWGGRFVSTPRENWHFELSQNFSRA